MNIRLDSTDKSIKVVAQEPIIKVEQVTTDIKIGVTGLQGPKGDKGDKGDAGDISDLNAGLNIEITEPVAGEVTVATVDDPDFTGIHFDTTTPITIANAGDIAWNSVDGTLDIKLLNDVTLQTGQELYFYGKASGAIANGDLCQFAGVQGDHILFKKVVPAEVKANHNLIVGVATTNIANNNFGYVTWFGKVNNVYTTGWTAGDLLYMDNTTGQLTNVAPVPPAHKLTIAAVIKLATGAAENGIILVRPTLGQAVAELEDVKYTSLSNGQVLKYTASTGVWENATLAISDTSGLQTALDSKVDENAAITGATKTKITYDAKGLVTAGADAGTSDITGLDTALAGKVAKAGDTMAGNLNMGTNKLIGGTGVTDILKLQSTTGNGTLTSAAIQLLTGNNGGTTALTVLNNGNVGIGTTSPTNPLHVAINTVTNSPIIQAQNINTGGGAVIGIDRANNPRVAGLQYSTAGSINWVTGMVYNAGVAENGYSISTDATLANTKLYVSTAGNVGIGTTSPSAKLHINDNNPVIYVEDSDFPAEYVLLANGGGNGYLRTVGNKPFYLGTNDSPRLTIAADGNVGIGTTTPGAKLQVDTGASTTIGQIIKGAASQTADLLQIQDSSANKLMVVSSGGNVGIGVAAPATPLEVNGIVRADRTAVPAQYIQLDGGDGNNTALRAVAANKFLYIDNSDTSGTNLYNAIVFRNGTAGDTERMRVDANGNVGIGTSSPGAQLQVVSSAATTIGQIIQGAVAQTADYLQIRTSGATAGDILAVKSSGRVGIGVSDPQAALEIAGDIETTIGANRKLKLSSATAYWYDLQSTNDDFQIIEASDVNKVRLTIKYPNGNVGIGTTAPSEKLDVSGTVKATGYKSSDGSAGVSGSFTTTDGKTITIKDGLVVSIV